MSVTHADYRLSQLDQLEAESIHIFREVAAEFEKPVLMFSGGKDSIVMMRLAEKAFFPAKIPFPVLQVDTGYDFPEVLACRDNWVNRLGVRLIVASVEEAIANGVVVDDGKTSRNRHQIGTLLNALEEGGFTAAFGGGRRDEEKARAKERVYSHRDEFGQWDPKMQRPELWSLYNGRLHEGEHMRIFPISNWTELDIWDYIGREGIEIPSIYFSHQRRVFQRDGMWMSESEFNPTREGETVEERTVRFRTVGDLTLTGCVESDADTIDEDHRGDRGRHRHRARRHPRRRPLLRGRHGGPEEGGLLLMPETTETPVPELIGREADLLRFATAGSVDDGKSTLIGRLLLDSKSIFEDQLEAVEATSASKGYDYTDLALLTDGLRSEREQGITIDVAYRYFATPHRKFIIADTPGHVQYTRNMVTGASTADLGLVLVDARQGLTEQSRRHAVILSLLRVPHLVLAVNKMDLVDYDQETYEKIHAEFTQFATKLNIPDLEVIPISALKGDNVVTRSENMGWYSGPTLMHHLEHVHVASDRDLVDVRFPVQYVVRPKSDDHHDYRGYAGMVAGGVLKPGDEVVVLPSGMTSRIAGIDLFDQEITEAFPPMSVTVRLEDDVDVSRGDMIARVNNAPQPSQDIDAMICWMTTQPLRPRQKLAIKHTTRTARALVKDIQYRLDVNTLHRDQETKELGLNEIGRIQLRTTQPLLCDPYSKNRTTGSFILIDEATGVTVGAGMINSGS